MKKIFFVFFVMLNSWLLSNAQESELAIAKIDYEFRHVNDTTQKEKHLRDYVVTYLGKSTSYFTSYMRDNTMEEFVNQANSPGFDGDIVLKISTTTISPFYVIKPTDKKLVEVKEIANDFFVINKKLEYPDWEIKEETKEIGGYVCQKAITEFAGRNYTAWFADELPFPYGPWRLHGLPGLILEAHDENKEVLFIYQGFDKLTNNSNIKVAPPENALHVTEQEFKKQQSAFDANPNAYYQTKGKANNNHIIGVDHDKIKGVYFERDENYNPSNSTNNPIERK